HSISKDKVISDPLFKVSKALMEKYRETSPEQEQAEGKFQSAYRKYIAGVLEANPKKNFYPDANSTLRLTYGKIRSLPRTNKINDAKANFYTTLEALSLNTSREMKSLICHSG